MRPDFRVVDTAHDYSIGIVLFLAFLTAQGSFANFKGSIIGIIDGDAAVTFSR
jgi:hypothetical protein